MRLVIQQYGRGGPCDGVILILRWGMRMRCWLQAWSAVVWRREVRRRQLRRLRLPIRQQRGQVVQSQLLVRFMGQSQACGGLLALPHVCVVLLIMSAQMSDPARGPDPRMLQQALVAQMFLVVEVTVSTLVGASCEDAGAGGDVRLALLLGAEEVVSSLVSDLSVLRIWRQMNSAG